MVEALACCFQNVADSEPLEREEVVDAEVVLGVGGEGIWGGGLFLHQLVILMKYES